MKLAAATAVLGDDAELSTVATLAGTSVEQAGAAVAELVRAEVLRERSPLGFVHPLVGAAVYRDLSTVERALAHDRAARLVAAGGGAAERVATHLLASPPRAEEWVVARLTTAARSALHKGAADSAVAYLARALREPPSVKRRARLLLELGRAETLTSGVAAVAHLREAYELLGDTHDRAVAAQMLGRTLLLTGRPAEGASLAAEAAAELPAGLDDLRSALEALELMAAVIAGSDSEALGRLQRHRRRPVGAGTGAKMLAAVAAHEWMMSGGPAEACAELALEALAGGEVIAADNGLLAVTAILVLTLADREEALQAWDASLADAHRHGSLLSKKSVTLWRGFTMYWRGELAEAEASMRSYAEGRLWGLGPVGRLYSDAVISAVLRERRPGRGPARARGFHRSG